MLQRIQRWRAKRRARKRADPPLTVTQEGFSFTTALGDDRRLNWDEVEEIRAYKLDLLTWDEVRFSFRVGPDRWSG